MAILFLFLVLQFGDAATTLAFLHRGVSEANPLIAAAFTVTQSPAVSLAIVKLGACGLGLFAWKSGRMRLLRRANVFFAACLVWNLAALAAA